MKKPFDFLTKIPTAFNNTKDILAFFFNQYSVEPATTPELVAESFRVRHKVYCAELGYEATKSVGEETDDYDKHSTHIVLQYKPLAIYIGCLRFVHGLWNSEEKIMPFEKTCEGLLDSTLISSIKQSGHGYAEISRLAIDKEFRHMGRVKGIKSPFRSSCALLALMTGIHAFSKIHDVRYMFAIVEERLMKSMARMSIPVRQIGAPTQHRGTRYPILIDREELDRALPTLSRILCNQALADMQKKIYPRHKGNGAHTRRLTPLPLFGKRTQYAHADFSVQRAPQTSEYMG